MRDFVYVKDVIQANIQSIKTEAEGVFNIGIGKETSLNELTDIIMRCTDQTVKVNYGPERIGDATGIQTV